MPAMVGPCCEYESLTIIQAQSRRASLATSHTALILNRLWCSILKRYWDLTWRLHYDSEEVIWEKQNGLTIELYKNPKEINSTAVDLLDYNYQTFRSFWVNVLKACKTDTRMWITDNHNRKFFTINHGCQKSLGIHSSTLFTSTIT